MATLRVLAFPARDEAPHVPRLAAFAARVIAAGTVDDALLLDGGSRDGTVDACRRHGLRVVEAASLPDPRHPDDVEVRGKGGAVRRLLASLSHLDVLVLLDADVVGLPPEAVARLVSPLDDPRVALVKGVCPRHDTDGGTHREGRVSALVARPGLDLLQPGLVGRLRDPLSGQVAVRPRSVRAADVADGYGLELAMLLDIVDRFGPEAVSEVDLGPIEHRHKDVEDLAPVARDVLEVLFERARRRARPPGEPAIQGLEP